MNRTVAVENNLTPYSAYLRREGYTVENMSVEDMLQKKMPDYDAYVVTGISENYLGFHDTVTKAPVINADGLTPEQVARMIERV
jgi:hypothetical protein